MRIGHAQIDVYRQNKFYTADKATLLLMFYQGAIDWLKRAREHMENRRIAEKGAAISKAHAIISELLGSLDFEAGGDLARSLEALYRFMLEQLMRAHVSNQIKPIEDVLSLLATLKEGWEGAVAQLRREAQSSRAAGGG
ncbi:MAG TPA: flagellar export chaperone FliS [candidate division Zixibacteria bacterium]|nr:flagellar export chaperone FliS [candidate division Zixibacteria bacterium]